MNDNGIGIDPEFLPYLFDRFRQGDSGTNRQSPGLGLGLAIVRHLVELHGGTVRAQSNGTGQGAAFTVRLPILRAPNVIVEKERVPRRSMKLCQSKAVHRSKNLKVLVVDDEADGREVASTILLQAQAEVRMAKSASEALEVMDEWRPDVLVADIGMPVVDGYGLIKQVRSRGPQSGGSVPAAALTAYARTQDRLRVLSAGFQMHVPKPIQPAELITVVASLAKRLR